MIDLRRRYDVYTTVVAAVATTGDAEIAGGWLRVFTAAIDGVRAELRGVVAHAFSVDTSTLHLLGSLIRRERLCFFLSNDFCV